MVKYFCSSTDIKSTWDHVVSAFWQRYPNPFSTHVLTEDVVYREVTTDHRLLSRRLLMKTNRLPRWAERFFPSGMSRYVYILEDSILDPVNRSLTTYTWNLNHTTLMSVEERCVFLDSAEQPSTTQLKREAWISSSIFGFSKPIQEFGLARFKSNQVKAMKGLEYALSNLQVDMWEKAIWSDETKLNLLAYMQNVAASCCGDVFQGCREREAGHLMGRRGAATATPGLSETPVRKGQGAKTLASAAAAPQKSQQYV